MGAREHRAPLLAFALVAVLAGLLLATGGRAQAATPDRDRHVTAVRYDWHTAPARWSYAVDPDRQPGEQIQRVYIAGRLAQRAGAVWVRQDVLAGQTAGVEVHVRVVTRRLDGTGGDNWHFWVHSTRLPGGH